MSRIRIPDRRYDAEDVLDWLNSLARRIVSGAFTWDPGSVSATSTLDTTLTTSDTAVVTGLRPTMAVQVTPPVAFEADLVVGAAWCPADDQLKIRLYNPTGSPINPASGEWKLFAWQT